jgi:hypothetical protein
MNSNRVFTPYIITGDPDTVNVSSTELAPMIRPGELGAQFDCNRNGRGFKYQLVKLDSGATASTPIGVVAANELAYWKDHANYLVTNDYRFSEAGSTANAYANFVAGVFRTAATAGNYCMILQRGHDIPVKAASTADGIGEIVIANTSTPAADITSINVGTDINYRALGVVKTAVSKTVAYVDLEIPDFD